MLKANRNSQDDAPPKKGFKKRRSRILMRKGKRVFMSAPTLDRLVFQLRKEPQTLKELMAALHLAQATINPILGALREGVVPYQRVRVVQWVPPSGAHGARHPVYAFGPEQDNSHRRWTPSQQHQRKKEKYGFVWKARQRGPAGPFDGLFQ